MNSSTIQAYIQQLKVGINIEGTNLDIKKEWWDLTTPTGKEEYVKDLTSMANSEGGDSALIIGIAGNGDIFNSPLPLDEATLQQMHQSKVYPRIQVIFEEIDLSGTIITAITIPHSTNRPHVIGRYGNTQNYIPIRYGSSTASATRQDLESMFQEREIPNAPEIKVTLFSNEVVWDNFAGFGGTCYMVRLTIDNSTGAVPGFITDIRLVEKTGNQWQSAFFLVEPGTTINSQYKIDKNDRKENVVVYLSDTEPEGLRNGRRTPPDIDKDQVDLVITTLDNQQLIIPTRPGYFRVG